MGGIWSTCKCKVQTLVDKQSMYAVTSPLKNLVVNGETYLQMKVRCHYGRGIRHSVTKQNPCEVPSCAVNPRHIILTCPSFCGPIKLMLLFQSLGDWRPCEVKNLPRSGLLVGWWLGGASTKDGGLCLWRVMLRLRASG